ncbi:BTAD domain-containing putative transcriptional regulator [Catenulispora pinisilvae]|uniref:BTAD domain-containing putative transcriptional regulator n=1 Tax=Catenulispora pinisilvae TaxID=2705253 RepID=UPI001890FBD6|nr:BTAD domain-containing putative transcriptional regulator [Catenulispora pinisilvae]
MTTNRLVRSAAAGAALLGGVLGLPYLLLTYLGNPIPATLPSPARIVWWLRSGQFDDHAAVSVLAYVLWACWVIFVVQIAAQLPGSVRAAVQARRGGQLPMSRTRNLIGGGAVQALLMALLMTLFVPRSALAATSSGPVDSSGLMSVRPAAVGVPVPGVDLGRGEQQAASVHVVAQGDNLWDIAAVYLGDSNRWPEIYEKNVGVLQPDGQVLTNPDIILPGWKLTMPVVAGSPTQGPVRPPSQVAQVSSFIPHDAESPSAVPAAEPTEPMRPTVQVSHTSPSAELEHTQAALRDRAAVNLGVDGYVGIGLAAGIAAALAAGRLRRRARARAHFPIPLDDVPADRATEVTAQLERAHLLTLAPPDVGYVQDEDDPYLTEWVVAEPPVPVERSHDEFGLPGLRASAEQEVIRTRKTLEAPAELAWGTTADGNSVPFMADEAAVDALALDGDGADAALRALMIAASTAEGVPDCGTATRVVTTVAVIKRVFGKAELGDVPRIRTAADLSTALDEIEDEISERRAQLRKLGLRNAADVRRFKPDHLMQPMLLITLPPGASHDLRLTDAVEAGRSLDIHAMVLGTLAGVTSVELDADGKTRAEQDQPASFLDGTRAFHVSMDAAEEALSVISEATPTVCQPAEPPVEAEVVPSPRTAASAEVSKPFGRPEPPVRVEVFDGLGVIVNGCDISGRFRPRLRTLLAYLGVNPAGAPREYLLQEIFALEVTTKTRHKFSTELSEIRRALRAAAPELTDAAFIDDDPRTERLRFEAATISSDLDLFTRLLDAANRAAQADQIEYLTEAVRLYRGPVLPIIEADWVETVREQQRRRALDAYHRLAHLVEGADLGYTIHLLENAIDVDRYNIETYQFLMRAQAAKGDMSAVRRTFELLGVQMEDLDDGVDQASLDLFERLTQGAGLGKR